MFVLCQEKNTQMICQRRKDKEIRETKRGEGELCTEEKVENKISGKNKV